MKNIYVVQQGRINRSTKIYQFDRTIYFSSYKKGIEEVRGILLSQGIEEEKVNELSSKNTFIDIKDSDGDSLRIVLEKKHVN